MYKLKYKFFLKNKSKYKFRYKYVPKLVLVLENQVILDQVNISASIRNFVNAAPNRQNNAKNCI